MGLHNLSRCEKSSSSGREVVCFDFGATLSRLSKNGNIIGFGLRRNTRYRSCVVVGVIRSVSGVWSWRVNRIMAISF
jgi:hypothetical protein